MENEIFDFHLNETIIFGTLLGNAKTNAGMVSVIKF